MRPRARLDGETRRSDGGDALAGGYGSPAHLTSLFLAGAAPDAGILVGFEGELQTVGAGWALPALTIFARSSALRIPTLSRARAKGGSRVWTACFSGTLRVTRGGREAEPVARADSRRQACAQFTKPSCLGSTKPAAVARSLPFKSKDIRNAKASNVRY